MEKVIFAAMMVLGVGAQAALVAGWDVDGVDLAGGVGVETNASPFAFHATTSETGRVTARMTLGAGVNPTTTAGQYGFKIFAADQTNSLAGAIALDHYMEVSIAVEPGHALDLFSLELSGQSSGTGCSNVVLMTSLDGFSSGKEIAEATNATATGGFDTDASGFGGPIDLTAPRYQNLTGAVSFRLYGWNSTSGSGATYVRNLTGDDLLVFGEIVDLTGDGAPMLSWLATNGTTTVSATFAGTASTNYVLQYRPDLADSNGWSTVSAPFATNSTWEIETTNSAGFYRVTTH